MLWSPVALLFEIELNVSTKFIGLVIHCSIKATVHNYCYEKLALVDSFLFFYVRKEKIKKQKNTF